ncbi:hypothetical protein [Vibrio harveyi]|uniref:hypothetical protein n=1 Tax=Vibrio harveyi TaxID=669 RepID=UPI003CF1EACA
MIVGSLIGYPPRNSHYKVLAHAEFLDVKVVVYEDIASGDLYFREIDNFAKFEAVDSHYKQTKTEKLIANGAIITGKLKWEGNWEKAEWNTQSATISM